MLLTIAIAITCNSKCIKSFISKGLIEIQGSPHDLVRSGVDFAKLVGILDTPTTPTPDVKENREFVRQRQLSVVSQTLSIESLNSLSECPDDEFETNVEGAHAEASSKGSVKGSLFVNYFTSGANWCVVLFLFIFFIFLQVLASATDYFVSIWIKQEEARTMRQSHNATMIPSYEYPSFTLSTELCIYIQGTLVVSLLILGISR